MWERLVCVCANNHKITFQPASLNRETTITVIHSRCLCDISTHAPVWGATNELAVVNKDRLISIHAPA